MNNNLFFFFTAKKTQCMHVSALRTAAYPTINSSHSKVIKTNQNICKVTVLNSCLPIIKKEDNNHNLYYIMATGEKNDQWSSFTSVAQQTFGTGCLCYTNSHSDTTTDGGHILILGWSPRACLHCFIFHAECVWLI